jgi:hypothetical protein
MHRLLKILLISLLLTGIAHALDVSRLGIRFDTHKGTIYFLEKGWFTNTQYPLKFIYPYWKWQSEDGVWHELYTPFISDWNEEEYLILDYGGRIFVADKKSNRRYQIKKIEGEWESNRADEWLPLDYGDYE